MRLRKDTNKDKEDGAVLLTTLLVMSLMATLAVSVMEDVTYAVRRAGVLEDTAQAEAYVEGAEGFVVAQLRELNTTLEPAEFNRLLAEPQVYTLPIEDGFMTLTVRDGTHCVSPADVLDTSAQRRFTRTLSELGLPGNEAAAITAALTDWQDADDQQEPLGAEDGAYLLMDPPYRTAGSPITSVSELRAVRGIIPEVWEVIAPWMCIDGQGTPININTLPLEEAALLAATLAKDTAFATGLLTSRPAEGYDETSFNSLPSISNVPGPDGQSEDVGVENTELITFSPDRVRVDIRVAFRDVVRRSALRVDLEDGEPVIIHQMRGGAALPLAKFPPDDDEEDENG